MSTVCAIVPTFNRKEMLGECLYSLKRQTRPPDQILVVDDGSTDGTADFVATRFGAKVKLLRKENGGKSSALNLGLAHCREDYVWICDDDDVAAPDSAAVLAEALDRAAPEIGFVFGHYRVFTEAAGEPLHLSPPPFWPLTHDVDVRISTMEDIAAFQFATLFRRTALAAAGPFREDLLRSQDLDMLLRVTELYDGTYVPQTIFYMRHHTGARGPTADRAAVAERHRRWLQYDTIFFAHLLKSTRSFCPTFSRGLPDPVRQRATLLQRAVVFGRRGMWETALPCLEEAALMSGGNAPLPEEREQAMRLIREGLPSIALPHSRTRLARLADLRRSSDFGALLMKEVGKVLLKRGLGAIAEKRFHDAAVDLRAAIAAGGYRAILRSSLARLAGKPLVPQSSVSAPHAIVTLQEREELRELLTDARTRLGQAPAKKATP